MTSLDDLRKALDAPDGFDRFAHRKRTERVKATHPHSVQYHELVSGSTCLTYALGLYKDDTYRAIAGPAFSYEVFAGKPFVERLLEQGLLVELEQAVPGCLVLYFADGVWKHAGTASLANRVISQWGTFPVYEHETFEVPARYGNQVRYFTMPDTAESLALFVEYAKSLGISDEDIADAVRYERGGS